MLNDRCVTGGAVAAGAGSPLNFKTWRGGQAALGDSRRQGVQAAAVRVCELIALGLARLGGAKRVGRFSEQVRVL
jgi:hypothetical protein